MKITLVVCSAVLAHFILKEKLHIFGVLGCVLCVVGSVTIVLHAPHEQEIESVKQVWKLAIEPSMYIYDLFVHSHNEHKICKIDFLFNQVFLCMLL